VRGVEGVGKYFRDLCLRMPSLVLLVARDFGSNVDHI